MRILLADDEPILLNFLKDTIKNMEFPFSCEIICAENGKKAYEILCDKPIDVAVVDIIMPEMTGLELIETVKKNKLIKTEFIVCSGYQIFSYAQLAVKLGAFDYLVKPVDADVLFDTLIHIKNKIYAKNDNDKIINNKYSSLVNRILDELEENLFSPELSLKWLCQQRLYVNETHAGRVFSKETGTKFGDYVKNARLKKAIDLIESNANISVLELAVSLGYENNPDYFIEIFKKKYQMTPKQYQKFLRQ